MFREVDIVIMDLYKCEEWLNDNLTREIRSSEYWNDEAIEKNKDFCADDGGFEKLKKNSHLRELKEQFDEITHMSMVTLQGNLLSLGAGTCWLEAWIMREAAFEQLIAVDFSRHRIHKLAPLTLAHSGIAPQKVRLVHGDILRLRVADASQDLVLLCQAFHHTDEPVRLLREIRRVLTGRGTVIIIGEHDFSALIQLKRLVKHLVKYGLNYRDYRKAHSLIPGFMDVFPPSPVKGDIHYSLAEYHTFFARAGFSCRHYSHENGKLQGFSLNKQ